MMKLKNSILKLATVAIIGCLPAAALAGAHLGGYDIRSFDDLEFAPVEGLPIEMSVLWDDPATGPSGFLVRIPPGFEYPMHSHTSNYRTVIIEGSALHWIEGEDKGAVEPVGNGGYWAQPGGQVHGDANVGDQPWLGLVIFDGPLDFIPAE
jgi:quercetin dioxygenase-like cupin family protein